LHDTFFSPAKWDAWCCSGCAKTQHKRPANRQSSNTGFGPSPSTRRLIDPNMHNLAGTFTPFLLLVFVRVHSGRSTLLISSLPDGLLLCDFIGHATGGLSHSSKTRCWDGKKYCFFDFLTFADRLLSSLLSLHLVCLAACNGVITMPAHS
jgi:hypothetical protein